MRGDSVQEQKQTKGGRTKAGTCRVQLTLHTCTLLPLRSAISSHLDLECRPRIDNSAYFGSHLLFYQVLSGCGAQSSDRLVCVLHKTHRREKNIRDKLGTHFYFGGSLRHQRGSFANRDQRSCLHPSAFSNSA